MFAGQPKRNRTAERVPDYPHRHEPQVLDQRSEVSDILANAARSGGALALAVSAAVICKNPKRIGQARNNQVPVVVGIPGPMHQDQRNVPAAIEFVEELDAIHLCRCHFYTPTLKPAGPVARGACAITADLVPRPRLRTIHPLNRSPENVWLLRPDARPL